MISSGDPFQLGVKALIRDMRNNILLLKVPQHKTNQPGGYWDLPGGAIAENETMVEALQREIYEKTRISELFNITTFMMVFTNAYFRYDEDDAGLIMAVHSCDVPTMVGYEITPDYEQAEWFTLSEAAELLAVKYPKEFTQRIEHLLIEK